MNENEEQPSECQHEFQSLPLTELRKLHYWCVGCVGCVGCVECVECAEFFDYEVDLSSEMLGWSMADMHAQFANELGGTYIGATTYDKVSR